MAIANLRSIETFYDGHRFRSRLEARWAVFFRELAIPYEYEPEGYKLSSGFYLPDFWLPRQDCWFEVKPAQPTEEEVALARDLGEITGKRSLIMFGQIPNPERRHYTGLRIDPHAQYPEPCTENTPFSLYEEEYDTNNGPGWMVFPYWDNHYEWCQCLKCGKFGIEYEARSARLPCDCHPDSDKEYSPWSEELEVAYRIALASRFEHGEREVGFRGGVTL
jgi:hypothetical protein